MKNKSIRKKLNKILDIAPELKQILNLRDNIDVKKKHIRMFLANLPSYMFDNNQGIHSLEWLLIRDTITVLENIIFKRNEQLAGFSLLQYIDDLLNKDDIQDMENPTPGFFAEIGHLLKGIMGKANLYSQTTPTFSKYEGLRASKLRSKDLSRIADSAHKYLNRYTSGLDEDVIRTRSNNKYRILKYFNATELEWGKWRWQQQNIIRNVKTLSALINLTDEEYTAVELANRYKIPFGITPYYLSLMDVEPHRKKDYAVRSQVIPSIHYVEKMKELRERAEPSMDFMLERDTSPIEGITRRYPKIAILKPYLTCPQICVYCQRNWEIEDVFSPNAEITKDKLEKAFLWLESKPEINEVLITGGDPLLLSNAKLERILFRLSNISHIERIRIGTRTPVTLPQRITDSLVRGINRFHNPGKREIIIVTHFEHPYEITPQSLRAVQRFRGHGMEVYNQMVFTFYNSKKFEATELRQKLRTIGVTPYYTFNAKGKEETNDFRVPISRLLQEQEEEARILPGTVRTDEIVLNVPRLGKNYLRAKQHHDIISILPDGRRVYEFHPWEKKLSLVDTYVYTDVSIYDYLMRLKAEGENIANYRTIWYYY